MTTEPTAPATSADPFDNAEYYDCLDSDTLCHTSPEEAVEDWLDHWMEPGCDVRKIIEAHECEITAYRREQVTEKWIQSMAEVLLDRAAEDFQEDFGDPHGEHQVLSDEVLKDCQPAMVAVVQKLVADGNVWRCERVASRVLDEDEVETMMREYNPHWFEPHAEPQAPLETPK